MPGPLGLLNDRLDQILWSDPVGQAVEVKDDSMAQRGESNGLQVLQGNIIAAFEQSTDFTRQDERLQATRAGTVANVPV